MSLGHLVSLLGGRVVGMNCYDTQKNGDPKAAVFLEVLLIRCVTLGHSEAVCTTNFVLIPNTK